MSTKKAISKTPNMFSEGFVIKATREDDEVKKLSDPVWLFTQSYTITITTNRKYRKRGKMTTYEEVMGKIFDNELYEKEEVLLQRESTSSIITPDDLDNCHTYRAPADEGYFDEAIASAKKTVNLFITKQIPEIIFVSIAKFHNQLSRRLEIVIRMCSIKQQDTETLRRKCGIYRLKEFTPRILFRQRSPPEKKYVSKQSETSSKPEMKVKRAPSKSETVAPPRKKSCDLGSFRERKVEEFKRTVIKKKDNVLVTIGNTMSKITFPEDKTLVEPEEIKSKLTNSIQRIKKLVIASNSLEEDEVSKSTVAIIALIMKTVFNTPMICGLRHIGCMMGYACAIMMLTNDKLRECCKEVFKNCVLIAVSSIEEICTQYDINLSEDPDEHDEQLFNITQYKQNCILYILAVHTLNGVSHTDTTKILTKIVSNTQTYIDGKQTNDVKSNLKLLTHFFTNVQPALNIKNKIIRYVSDNDLKVDSLCTKCKTNEHKDMRNLISDLAKAVDKLKTQSVNVYAKNTSHSITLPIDNAHFILYNPKIRIKPIYSVVEDEESKTISIILKIDTSNPKQTTIDYSEKKQTKHLVTYQDESTTVCVSKTTETTTSIQQIVRHDESKRLPLTRLTPALKQLNPMSKPFVPTRITEEPKKSKKARKDEEDDPFTSAIARRMKKK